VLSDRGGKSQAGEQFRRIKATNVLFSFFLFA